MTALPLFALCALSFAGYDRWIGRKWVKALFIFVPASNILLVSANGLHGWVWSRFVESAGNLVIFEHGPAFGWIVFNGYAMILIIIVALWITIRKGSEIARRQGRLLLGAALFPLIANVVYNFWGGADGLDWTSVTFSITGLLFLQALHGTRLWDLAPVARDQLVNSMSDGMIVLDTQNRVIDMNEAAARMIGSPLETFLGRDVAHFAPQIGSFGEQQIEYELHTELEVNAPGRRYFDVLHSPLRNRSQEIMGRLIVFREITERKQTEQDLEQRFLEIQELNKNLNEASHNW